MDKIELEIIAVSHSMTQSHSYAIVLGEINGIRKLPVVIGAFEAQAIALALEKMTPNRPLTHDLMKSMCTAFEIELKEIIINNWVDGVFFAQLVCQLGNDLVEIDSRTSDAVALAIRFNCPIYTYDSILESAGLIIESMDQDEDGEGHQNKPRGKGLKKNISPNLSDISTGDLSKASMPELNEMLQKYIEKEDYEKAIAVRDEIGSRKTTGDKKSQQTKV